ncbi:thioredoxin family protein [Chamaesiphon minutus]|uniref:Peroxiredoxin n=1 Tax=Chamaesiphon minutus (strain ATCC 27169 / PCC 6605) TaxID=1173020 RepID=K9UF17_CHAP6|nr:thioredoxin family protein [Chamaesiphon minutus]AFY93717.1 Peroxiredoxin [Chamaesiphon minutus PCC 6605]
MVRTASTMLPLGVSAPDFNLTDVVSEKPISLATFAGKPALLVMFISVHCPFVKHVQAQLAQIGKDYAAQGLGVVAIGSNDIEKYPDDAPEHLQGLAHSEGFNFPVCADLDQVVAKAYTAACTPDFFLFDSERYLAYRGQLDDSRPSNGKPVTGQDLRQAIELLLAGKEVDPNQRPSIGCNIKWIPGNEPEYFTGVRAED